jgi:hypothetical protein
MSEYDVLAGLMILVALLGFAFQAGQNYQKRQERERWRAWYRSMRGEQ